MSENKSRVITSNDLYSADACYTYTQRFNSRFPSGKVDMTVGLAVDQAQDWDWYFAAGAFLKDREVWGSKIVAAEGRYRDSIHPYREMLSAARVEARKPFDGLAEKFDYYTDEYYREHNRLEEEYNRAIAVPRAAYNAACHAAELELAQAQARTFAELYIAEGDPIEVEQESDDSACDCDGCKFYNEN